MSEQKCYDYNSLEAYWYNQLPVEVMAQIARHVEKCSRCQAQILAIQLAGKTQQELRDTTADFRQTRQKIEGLKTSLAQLVFDSRLTPPNHGVSGGFRAGAKIEEAPCHLLYSVEDGRLEIDMQLRQTGTGEGYSLIGQVTGEAGEEAPWVVLLGLNNEWAAETSPDETCTFLFQNVPAGNYALKLFCDSEAVEISTINL
jgi:hypothetical protein